MLITVELKLNTRVMSVVIAAIQAWIFYFFPNFCSIAISFHQVIDIVRSNVRAVLQRTWRVPDVDGLQIYRVFSRVFNRLLWSHGQGLWNCFASSG